MKLRTPFAFPVSLPVSLVAGIGALAGLASLPLAAQTASFVYAQTTLGSGMSQPHGVAVDAAGNLYIADSTGNQVVRIDAATGAQTTLGSGLLNPSGIAVNSAGDVFIADSSNNRVVVVPAGGGPQLTVGASGLVTPLQIAVDASDNLYIVDNGNGRVVKVWANGTAPSVVASGLSNPQGVAVDGSGDVYIAENSGEDVLKIGPSGGVPTKVASGLIPTQLAVDAAGDLFIAVDGGLMEVPSGGGVPVNPTPGLGGYALGVAVDANGRLYVAEGSLTSVSELQTGAVDFGTVPLCPASQRTSAACAAKMTLTFNVSSPSQVYPYSVSTRGLGFTEFTYGESTTCGTQAAGSDCTIAMSFAPTAPGLRRSAVILGDQHGNTLASVPVYGTGLGPQIDFGGATQSNVGSGFNQPSGMVLDGAGDLFVTDTLNNRVVEIPANGGAQSTVGSGLALPVGIAIDGLGNLYVSELGAGDLVSLSAFGSQFTLASGFAGPAGVAVDALDDIYIANSSGGVVAEIVASTAKVTTIGTGLSGPAAVALDSAGDLFIADTTNDRVVEVTPGGVQSTVASGFDKPQGIAVDAAGDLFVADTGNNRVVEVPAGGGAQFGVGSGFKSPTGLLLDDAGNLYVADTGNNRVVKIERSAAPTLHFAATLVGQTSADSPRALTAQNTGNQPLNLANVSYPVDFPVDFDAEDGLCTGSASLAPGQQCALPVDFTPLHGGALSETLSITDDALNVSGTVHSIALSGSGLLSQDIVFLPPATLTFGAAPLNLGGLAKATSGLPVSFKVVSGPATLKGSVLTITGAGSVVVQASQAGNASYVAATPVTTTIAVAKATPVIAWASPSPIVYGTRLGAAQLDAKSAVAGKFVYSPAAGTVLPVGTQTLTVEFMPASTANYLTANAKVTITIAKATLTVTAKSFTIKKGTAIPTLTAIYSGFVNGDTVKVLSGAPSLSTTAKAGSPVGTYPITIQQHTLFAKNYSFKLVSGTLTITSASGVKKHPMVNLPLPPPSPAPPSLPWPS
jgi:sugar lactone lactonase YvrE